MDSQCAAWHNVFIWGWPETRSCVVPVGCHMVYPDGNGDEVVYHWDLAGSAWAVWRPVQVDSSALDDCRVEEGKMAKVRAGDTEFGGGDGMIQRNNIDDDVLSPHERVMAIYATDPGDPLAPKPENIPDARRVGVTSSYNPPSPKGWNAPHE